MSKFEYVDFPEPRPCTFADGKEHEAIAISANSWLTRVRWGDSWAAECCVPSRNVKFKESDHA